AFLCLQYLTAKKSPIRRSVIILLLAKHTEHLRRAGGVTARSAKVSLVNSLVRRTLVLPSSIFSLILLELDCVLGANPRRARVGTSQLVLGRVFAVLRPLLAVGPVGMVEDRTHGDGLMIASALHCTAVFLVASWLQDLGLFWDQCLGVCSLLKLSNFGEDWMLDVGRAWIDIGKFSLVLMSW
ncbi:hypothetical protein BJ166DRAFT_52486, partial [Pestalotiopsis sp. NC0098]